MPDIVECAVRASGPGVTFAAEHVNKPEWIWRPVGRASTRSHSIIHVAELKEVNRIGDVSSWLIDVYGTLPPNPLAGAQLIFPNVIEEAGRLCPLGTEPKASKEEQIAIGVGPTDRSPTRARNVRRCGVGCSV